MADDPVLHEKDEIASIVEGMLDIKNNIERHGMANIKKAQTIQKKNFDKRHTPKTWTVGTKVLIYNMKDKQRQGGKMNPKKTGPYEILIVGVTDTYTVRNINKPDHVFVSNGCLFKQYYENEDTKVTGVIKLSHDELSHSDLSHEDIGPKVKKPKVKKTEFWIRDLNLHKTDMPLITRKDGQLNDRCMDAASSLLRKKFPTIPGFHSTINVQYSNICERMGSSFSVQLINQPSRNHWIVRRDERWTSVPL